jgi:hypothetical protein
VKTPPMLFGRAGVIVTAHSPVVEENTTGPSGPVTVNESSRSGLVVARLTKETPERRSCCADGSFHVMSIGAGGGAQTAGVAIDANGTSIVRSPDSVRVATPVSSALSGPGDPVGVGERVGEGDPSSGGGGDTLTPWPTPVEVHAAVTTVRRAPSTRVLRHVAPIPPSLLHALRRTGTYDRHVPSPTDARSPGVVPASVAAGIAFATTVAYLVLIMSEGDLEPFPVLSFAAYFAGLGMCALLGAIRGGPDRVVWLGAATGGLIGAGIIAIFSIGLLFLVAGFCTMTAWMRSSVGVPRRQQLFAAVAAVGVPIGLFFIIVLA